MAYDSYLSINNKTYENYFEKKKIFYFLYLALSYSVYLHIPDKSLVGGKVPITSTQLA